MSRNATHRLVMVACFLGALAVACWGVSAQGWPGETSPKVAPFHFWTLANIPPTWDPQAERYTNSPAVFSATAQVGSQWSLLVANYSQDTTMAVRTFVTLIPPLSPKLNLGTHYSRFAPDGLTFMVMNGIPPFSGPAVNNMGTDWIGLRNTRYGPGLFDWTHDLIATYLDVLPDPNLVGLKFYVEGLCGLSTSGYIDPPVNYGTPENPIWIQESLRVAQPAVVAASFGPWESITIVP